MKKASIISVGNEVLSGLTIDTNAAHLSRELLSLGIPVVSGYTVADEIEAITGAIGHAWADADVILITGGLGPTDDDLTRSAVAKFLDVQLEFRAELLDRIKAFFDKRGRQMSDTNRVQAFLPIGVQPLDNPIGTAAGLLAEKQGKLLAALPGVPSEMKQMFRDSLAPRLHPWVGSQIVKSRKLRCFGTGESNIAEMLGSLMQRGRNPLINCTVHGSIITLHIIAQADAGRPANQMLDRDEQQLRQLLGDLVFGCDEQTLAEVVGAQLASQGKTVATAESCTGGLLAGMLTEVPGASQYFIQGWVTYTNQSKMRQLGVPRRCIDAHGAVSEQVARAMAAGARRTAGTDFGIGITGIAGPAGGTEQKPVGLVYIGVDSASGVSCEKHVFSHGRSAVRLRSVLTALNLLRRNLKA